MNKDCRTCIYKEGSCYPSLTIFDKDKTCKSYRPDYEGYIADLEKENTDLRDNYVQFKASAIPEIERLQKENAELKGLKDVATLIRANNDTVVTLMQLNNMLVSRTNQLTKAKELLTKWLFFNGFNSALKKETEDFLGKKTEEIGIPEGVIEK